MLKTKETRNLREFACGKANSFFLTNNKMPNVKISKSDIRFHEATELPFGALSIMSPHSLVVRRVTYQSVYHFFLCMKYKSSPTLCEQIRSALSQWELDKIVRKAEAEGLADPDWERQMIDVMVLGVYYKFKQNADAAMVLNGTGNRNIYDHCADPFWGDGGDGSGRNHMGSILMAVRRRLASEEKVKEKKPVHEAQRPAAPVGSSVFGKRK